MISGIKPVDIDRLFYACILTFGTMKQVLAFGSGGAVMALQRYFSQQDDEQVVLRIVEYAPAGEAGRQAMISNADIVISLLDGEQQQLIAEDCIRWRKHLVSAAGLNEKIINLRPQVESSNILFLYEMGFDPGLDHMSVLQCINAIRAQGGNIIGVHTHSGRLVAPEHDDNPWHFKTNNPQQLINAGKKGAVYKEKNAIHQLPYAEISTVHG